MSTTTETKTATVSRSRLSATDPNLAFLASRAAIELDRILQGKSIGTEAIGELAGLLRNSSENIVDNEEPATLWDPATISLIHSAIARAGFNKVVTLKELMSRAISIAEELESTGAPAEDEVEIRRLPFGRRHLRCHRPHGLRL